MTVVHDLLQNIMADGTPQEEAVAMRDRVLAAILPTLLAGRVVRIPGVGTLRVKKRRRRITAPGPDYKKGIEERVVYLQHGATIEAGEPYEVLAASPSRMS